MNAKDLQTKHLRWMMDWAKEGCARQINEAEAEYVRHSTFATIRGHETIAHKWGNKAPSRTDRQFEILDSLTELRAVYEAIEQLADEVANRSHREFAAQMSAHFGKKGRRS